MKISNHFWGKITGSIEAKIQQRISLWVSVLRTRCSFVAFDFLFELWTLSCDFLKFKVFKKAKFGSILVLHFGDLEQETLKITCIDWNLCGPRKGHHVTVRNLATIKCAHGKFSVLTMAVINRTIYFKLSFDSFYFK